MVFTPEHRAHIRKARLGQKASIAARANMSVAQTGLVKQPHTPEAKAKIRAANLGKKASPETRAKISAAQMGHEVSPETRAKIGAWIRASGSDHPLWRGGDRNYGPGFSDDLKRIVRWLYDDRRFLCGEKPEGREPAVHHIDYNKKNNTIDNLVPLCNSHHSQTNTRRDYWQWFLRLRMRIAPFNSWEMVA